MKAICLQENLKTAFNITSRSVASQPQLPVLANILVKAEKNKIKLSATNLSQSINLWINAKVEKEGAITVPAKIISEFVNSLPPGKLQLVTEKENFKISSGKFKAIFNGLAASEYPTLSTIKETKVKKKKYISLQLPFSQLSQAILQTAFAAAIDESRPVLTGVLWQAKKNTLSLAATDGYRLSLKKLKLKIPQKIDLKEFIIPANTLQEIIRLEGEKESIEMLIVPGGKQVIFGLDDLEIISQLLEGEYPDFTKIIPQAGETKIILDREEFLQAVQISSIFAREAANIIKFEIQNGKLKISANSPQLGGNESLLEVKTQGKPNKIAFNSRFVLDFLKSIQAEEIEMEMASPTSPAIFSSPKNQTYRHIIMPVRVQEEK